VFIGDLIFILCFFFCSKHDFHNIGLKYTTKGAEILGYE